MDTEKPFEQIRLPVKAICPLPANPVSIVPYSGGYWLNFAHIPEVVRLDKDLQEKSRYDLQAHSQQYVSSRLSVSPDESLLALCGRDSLRIFDAASGVLQHTIPHSPWYHFLGSNAHFTGDGQYLWYVRPDGQEGDDLLCVVSLHGFAIAGEQVLTGNNAHNYTFHATPDPDTLLLEAAAGQDDALLYLLRREGTQIITELLHQCPDRIFGSFAPAGDRFVTAPHYDEGIVSYAFPEVRALSDFPQEHIFAGRREYPSEEEADTLHYVVFYLNDHHLLAQTRYGRLLLLDALTGGCTGELLPEGCLIRAYNFAGDPVTDPSEAWDYGGDIVEARRTPDGHLLITHSEGALRLYALPERFP